MADNKPVNYALSDAENKALQDHVANEQDKWNQDPANKDKPFDAVGTAANWVRQTTMAGLPSSSQPSPSPNSDWQKTRGDLVNQMLQRSVDQLHAADQYDMSKMNPDGSFSLVGGTPGRGGGHYARKAASGPDPLTEQRIPNGPGNPGAAQDSITRGLTAPGASPVTTGPSVAPAPPSVNPPHPASGGATFSAPGPAGHPWTQADYDRSGTRSPWESSGEFAQRTASNNKASADAGRAAVAAALPTLPGEGEAKNIGGVGADGVDRGVIGYVRTPFAEETANRKESDTAAENARYALQSAFDKSYKGDTPDKIVAAHTKLGTDIQNAKQAATDTELAKNSDLAQRLADSGKDLSQVAMIPRDARTNVTEAGKTVQLGGAGFQGANTGVDAVRTGLNTPGANGAPDIADISVGKAAPVSSSDVKASLMAGLPVQSSFRPVADQAQTVYHELAHTILRTNPDLVPKATQKERDAFLKQFPDSDYSKMTPEELDAEIHVRKPGVAKDLVNRSREIKMPVTSALPASNYEGPSGINPVA